MVWIDYDDGHNGGYPHECPRYCSVCEQELSLEVGIVRTSTLADGAPFALFCKPCSPNKGDGYTLADLERMKAENQAARGERQMRVMEKLGPDVYFHVLGAPPNPDGAEELS